MLDHLGPMTRAVRDCEPLLAALAGVERPRNRQALRRYAVSPRIADLDPDLQRASVKVTLPLFLPPEGRPFGWQDPEEWDAFGAWMQEKNLLENPPDVRSSYDNGLLPGSGL